jgi:hypothetical protein
VRDHFNRAGVQDGHDDDVTRRPCAERADGGPLPIWSASACALAVLRLMSSMVWPCFVARVPMAVAMLPEPMMLIVVMTCVPLLCMDQLVVGVLLAYWAGVSKVRRRPGVRSAR